MAMLLSATMTSLVAVSQGPRHTNTPRPATSTLPVDAAAKLIAPHDRSYGPRPAGLPAVESVPVHDGSERKDLSTGPLQVFPFRRVLAGPPPHWHPTPPNSEEHRRPANSPPAISVICASRCG